MNKRIYILSTLVTLLAMLDVTGNAQVLHEVVLTVDTKKPITSANHTFSVGSKTAVVENTPGNRFTILVDVGDSLLWRAKADGESNESINIVGVNYVSGPRIFSSNALTGKGTVKATTIRGGPKAYVYKLLYTIGLDTEIYSITASIKTKM